MDNAWVLICLALAGESLALYNVTPNACFSYINFALALVSLASYDLVRFKNTSNSVHVKN